MSRDTAPADPIVTAGRFNRVTFEPGKMGGRACIRGLRITVGHVLSLLAEGVAIRDLGTIVEAIGDKARTTRDTSLLSEYARQALGRAITAPHLDEQLRLQAITLDPSIEQEVSTSITQTTDGEYLAMDPPRAQAIVNALRAQVDHANARSHGGRAPVVLCSARIRRHLRRLIAQAQPHLAVCSYNEIAPGINVETVGVIHA